MQNAELILIKMSSQAYDNLIAYCEGGSRSTRAEICDLIAQGLERKAAWLADNNTDQKIAIRGAWVPVPFFTELKQPQASATPRLEIGEIISPFLDERLKHRQLRGCLCGRQSKAHRKLSSTCA